MSKKTWAARALALTCSAAMLVPLAACGGGTNDAGKITLSYLSWDNEQTSKPYIDEFEKENPDIKIDFSYSPPTSEYLSTLQTRLVGNQAPDVFIITSENRDDLIDNGYAKDLTDEPFMKNISQANKDFLARDGKVYGMSIISWASGVSYNKDLLKQVGYDEPPANWDDFLTLCKKLKAAGIEPLLEPNADEPSRFIDAFQGSILTKKNIDPTTLINENPQKPGTDELDAVKAYARLYDEGGVTRDTVGIGGDDMRTQFTTGQVAMIVDGAWAFSTYEQSGMNWGFAPMPKLGDDYEQWVQGSASPGWAIYSKLDGDKLKAAEKFLTFMSSKWALDTHNKAGDAVTVTDYQGTVMDQYKQVFEQNIQTGKYYLHTNYYSKPDVLKSELKAQNQQLVQGQITPAQYAKNLDEKMSSAQ
ncbi:ABC transporter substrate-binding protein [Bifidobacterium sp. UTCIF-37]|uniref:ABC transporter substrate-binding protein n=1 Tax=unclassified Bifidobacterium TaxID=2608897 RepID=UPI00112822AC|nr:MULTISPECIES: extracellular solute-binding protein [unclassified Bifidobacterium]TPF85540.1 ABC transporter substrate-binding protein [Bifidobacterium sp. UTCIF-37]TPF87585.1 ABC transporter substrate-binding protein [Bifidobacterium sp. UTCIF-38]